MKIKVKELFSFPVLSDAIQTVEIQFLMFPVLVVVFAWLSLMCGGSCCASPWWWAFGIVLVGPFLKKTVSCSIATNLMFITAILLIGICVFLSVDTMGTDEGTCHLSAIHALINGWNPVHAVTPEEFSAQTGLDVSGMRGWHVLFYQKSLWVFNAVAYFFYRDSLSVLQPLMCYMALSLFLTVFRVARGSPIWLRLLAVFLTFRFCYSSGNACDSVVCLAGVGLLITMADDMRRNAVSICQLLVYSFWLLAAKPSGIMAFASFWGVYLVWGTIRRLKEMEFKFPLKSLFAILGSVVLLFALVNVSPYWTAYSRYGHCLYPHLTADEETYPVIDLTRDFHTLNDDAKEMGLVGLWANAYFSPTLTAAYYKWKLGRDAFFPSCYVWERDAALAGGKANCPMTDSARMKVWFTLLLLLLVPGFRLTALQFVVALIAAPPILYGYLRYFPWLMGLWVFPFVFLLKRFCHHFSFAKWGVALSFIALFGLDFARIPMYGALRIDVKRRICRIRPEKIFTSLVSPENKEFYATHPQNFQMIPGSDPQRGFYNYLQMLARRLPNLNGIQVQPFDCQDETVSSELVQTDFLAYVRKGEIPELEISRVKERYRGPIVYFHYCLWAYSSGLSDLWRCLHG